MRQDANGVLYQIKTKSTYMGLSSASMLHHTSCHMVHDKQSFKEVVFLNFKALPDGETEHEEETEFRLGKSLIIKIENKFCARSNDPAIL